MFQCLKEPFEVALPGNRRVAVHCVEEFGAFCVPRADGKEQVCRPLKIRRQEDSLVPTANFIFIGFLPLADVRIHVFERSQSPIGPFWISTSKSNDNCSQHTMRTLLDVSFMATTLFARRSRSVFQIHQL